MILNNLLGTDNPDMLALEEERLGKLRALELFEQRRLDFLEPGTFDALAAIHKFLFEEIYPFAGTIRHENLAKGFFCFAPARFLYDSLAAIDRMPQATFDQIIEKYVEMNIAHPFREGNGRSIRLWLNHLLQSSLQKVIDWSAVDKDEYLHAMERSPVDDSKLKELLYSALCEQTQSIELYGRGVDASFRFEGMEGFLCSELLRTETVEDQPI